MRIAVTGHMNLTVETEELVRQAVMNELASCCKPAELIGISCIARGADTIFAQAVLDGGGRLEVVLPSADYRQVKVKPDHAARFDLLIDRAEKVHVGRSATANRAAYEEANEILLSASDVLFAVWDGAQGADKGGTASVVELAESRGLAVRVIWPDGARRG
jgi:hypothetical protein